MHPPVAVARVAVRLQPDAHHNGAIEINASIEQHNGHASRRPRPDLDLLARNTAPTGMGRSQIHQLPLGLGEKDEGWANGGCHHAQITIRWRMFITVAHIFPGRGAEPDLEIRERIAIIARGGIR